MATSTLSATDNDFLGSSYEVPASSGGGGKYLKFKKGTTHFRVLSQKALKGWEYWADDNKPKRLQEKPTSTPADVRIGEDGKAERIRHFWAMAVWDYEASAVKILQISQSTIQKSIVALVQDRDFGHPTKYDLKVSRSGEGLETEYNVMPLHKPMPQEAIDAIEQTPIYLEALWVGADPFLPESEKYAPAMPTISNVDIDRKWVEDSGLEPAKAKEIRERLLGKKKFSDYTTDDMSKLKTALEVAAAEDQESEPTQPISLSQPAVNPAGIRIRELKKLTKHTTEQLKEIAAKCTLPLSSASYTQEQTDRFVDHVLLNWITDGEGGGSDILDDACAVLANGGSDLEKFQALQKLADEWEVDEDEEIEAIEVEVQDSEPDVAIAIEDLPANPF